MVEGGMEQVEIGDEIQIIECRTSEAVPRAVWMWMEEQIREGDGVTRRKAQDILRPRERGMRYVLAILREGDRQDGMGRSRRVTRMLNYNENRTYTHSTTEVSEVGVDRGQTQNTSQWGWRLYEERKRW